MRAVLYAFEECKAVSPINSRAPSPLRMKSENNAGTIVTNPPPIDATHAHLPKRWHVHSTGHICWRLLGNAKRFPQTNPLPMNSGPPPPSSALCGSTPCRYNSHTPALPVHGTHASLLRGATCIAHACHKCCMCILYAVGERQAVSIQTHKSIRKLMLFRKGNCFKSCPAKDLRFAHLNAHAASARPLWVLHSATAPLAHLQQQR